MKTITSWPWITMLLVWFGFIASVVGGAVVIWGDPGVLSFDQYLDHLQKFALALAAGGAGKGLFEIGKALKKGK